MVLLNMILALVFVVVSVTGYGHKHENKHENGVYWLESGTTCRKMGAPDEDCVHYSKCSQRGRGISNFRTEFCRFDGPHPVLCCIEEYLPYESSEEHCEEEHPFTFTVDEDDYHKPHHHYGHDAKPTTPSYHGYHPEQKPRPAHNYFPPNGGYGNQKPSTYRPIFQTTEAVKNPIFIAPSTKPPISITQEPSSQRPILETTEAIKNPVFTSPTIQSPNSPSNGTVNDDNRQNSNIMTNISNIPIQQQNNPPENVQVAPIPVSPSTGVAEQKCREFFRALPLTKPKHTPIIGGRPANPKEFPHLVLLGYGTPDSKKWACAGTLISDQFVLTAAHCLNSQFLGTVKFVRLGELDVTATNDDADEKDFDVIESFRHPMYTFGSNYNDIALIRFNGSVPFTPYIRPACLSITKNVENVTMIASGWGLTEDGVPASILQRATLKHVSNERCNTIYGKYRNLRNGIIDEIQVCADGGREVRDACRGDSGGPLQYTNYDFDTSIGGVIEIVGITSFGKGCGLTAGVYTRVLPYVPWIESIVWR